MFKRILWAAVAFGLAVSVVVVVHRRLPPSRSRRRPSGSAASMSQPTQDWLDRHYGKGSINAVRRQNRRRMTISSPRTGT